jgi:hypothetical protein
MMMVVIFMWTARSKYNVIKLVAEQFLTQVCQDGTNRRCKVLAATTEAKKKEARTNLEQLHGRRLSQH